VSDDQVIGMTDRLGLLDDGLDQETRAAFASAFHLAELAITTAVHLEPIHQELRLAIQIWRTSRQTESPSVNSAETSTLEHLIGRDHLVLVRGQDDQLRLARTG